MLEYATAHTLLRRAAHEGSVDCLRELARRGSAGLLTESESKLTLILLSMPRCWPKETRLHALAYGALRCGVAVPFQAF